MQVTIDVEDYIDTDEMIDHIKNQGYVIAIEGDIEDMIGHVENGGYIVLTKDEYQRLDMDSKSHNLVIEAWKQKNHKEALIQLERAIPELYGIVDLLTSKS